MPTHRLSSRHSLVIACALAFAAAPLWAAAPSPPTTQHKYIPPPRAITGGGNAPLKYLVDDKGDRVPDYSFAGYRGGGFLIPNPPVRVTVSPVPGDNTPRIQAAIDYVSKLPLDANGLRGTILLEKGRFEVAGGLRIAASGVVLRGSGPNADGTQLIATGVDRRTLITVAGRADQTYSPEQKLADAYFPVNSTQFRMPAATTLKVGDRIILRRPCTYEWIKALGMDYVGGDRHAFNWNENTRELLWDRSVTAVNNDHFTIDAPITCSLDPQYGGGLVSTYNWPGRVSEVGVENLRCISVTDLANPKDENHSWMAVTIENAQDCWVRQLTGEHFVSSIVSLWDSTKRITVEDCRSFAPVSENAGYRRYTFFTNGQQTLFQRCHAEFGRHDYSVGFCAAGPNAFVQCYADQPLADSGPIDSWAAGILYDNVKIDGNELNLHDRGYRGKYAGWSAANCFIWQTHASGFDVTSPPTAKNWAYGCWGQFTGGTGVWASTDESINPDSLYYAQLADRLGPDMLKRAYLMREDLGDTPSNRGAAAEETRAAIEEAKHPAPRMQEWTDEVARKNPISTLAQGAKRAEDIMPTATPIPVKRYPLAVHNGVLTVGDEPLAGSEHDITWWNGGIRPDDVESAARAAPMPTRFVPGRTGFGLTEDLNELTDRMVRSGGGALDHHYGLWYDTRDADHERVRREDGDVCPPFYEMPFARSGQGQAWDGLSKYDLTKFNPWFFSRLSQFADLAQQKKMALISEHFFQHNILEAGAHWASSQWRDANNINNMGFPEPPMYAGDKRIFVAEQFYDVTNKTRTGIYRGYIRHQLESFGPECNVIHETSAEFQGPLPFVQFWLDVIGEWEKETGKHPIIALAATKDVQDAILADPVRSKVVDVIDIKYWTSNGNGFNAPAGGKNLAPRQNSSAGRAVSDETLRNVQDYRKRYPDKAIINRTFNPR